MYPKRHQEALTRFSNVLHGPFAEAAGDLRISLVRLGADRAGAVGAQELLEDLNRLLAGPLSLRVLPLRLLQGRLAVVAGGNVGVLRPLGAFLTMTRERLKSGSAAA